MDKYPNFVCVGHVLIIINCSVYGLEKVVIISI